MASAVQQIKDLKNDIDVKVIDVQNSYAKVSLQANIETNPSKSAIRNLDDDLLVSFVEMASVSDEGFIERTEVRPLKAVRKGSYTYFADNDVIVAKITPCMENGKCALATNLSNGIGMGSSEFHVFRTNEKLLPAFLFYQLNRDKVRNEAEQKMTGSSGHRRVPIGFYEQLKIVVPPLPVQQQFVEQIEILEAQIATAKQTIANAPAQKQTILKKWLE